MRVIIQRTSRASVTVGSKIVGEIGSGLLVLLGVFREDTTAEAEYLARRIPQLRVFGDRIGKMNLDLRQAGGDVLVVSNFTLCADLTRGRRPGWDSAASPVQARQLFDYFVQDLRCQHLRVETGIFGAHMEVMLVNDGPVTLILDSPPKRRADSATPVKPI